MRHSDYLDYLADKLDILDSRLDSMASTLIIQQEQLKEHMRRSELNEKAIEILKNELKPIQSDWKILRFLIAAVIGIASPVYYYLKIKGVL
jgi:hypothetical protein